MVAAEMRELIRGKIDDVPEDKLTALRAYIDYLTGEDGDEEADAYDYELSREADERTDKEYISLDEALKEAGLTYADLQK